MTHLKLTGFINRPFIGFNPLILIFCLVWCIYTDFLSTKNTTLFLFFSHFSFIMLVHTDFPTQLQNFKGLNKYFSLTYWSNIFHCVSSFVFVLAGFNKVDDRPIEEIVREKLLTVLESAYPNVLSVEDLVRYDSIHPPKSSTFLLKGFIHLNYFQPNSICLVCGARVCVFLHSVLTFGQLHGWGRS